MKATSAGPRTVDEYIADLPRDVQPVLRKIRRTIRQAAPGVEEVIKYHMPTFVLPGRSLHVAAWKKHIGLYGTWPRNAKLRAELAAYAGPKGSLKFPLDEPIPLDLIGRMVELTAKEVRAPAGARAGKK